VKTIIVISAIFLGISSYAQGTPAPGPTPEATQIKPNEQSTVSTPAPAPSPSAAPRPMPSPTPIAAIANEDSWRFAGGLSYMISASSAKFDNMSVTSGTLTETGSASLDYSQVFSIAIEWRRSPKFSWGFSGGLNYEMERTFEGGKITSGGTTVTLSGGSGASKFQFTTLYGNAAYRWDTFYIPMGFNYSIVTFTPASGATGTSTPTGQIGAQLGIGNYFSDNFALELFSWVTATKLKSTSGSSTVDYGLGTFPSLRFGFKYIF
jgi:hypothetical protein